MRKSLLIGLIICLLAAGSIGAAFAAGMGIGGVGALSKGTATISGKDVASVSYNLDDYGSLKEVVLTFAQDLPPGTEICVELLDSSVPETKAIGKYTLGGTLTTGSTLTIDLNGDPVDTVALIDQIEVTIAE